ncbi:mediator of RNA polymerase II transcription subunit 13 isoform X1 [Tanacetum coccineum]
MDKRSPVNSSSWQSSKPVQTDGHLQQILKCDRSNEEETSPFDRTTSLAFSDADHAGCVDTHKSTSGGIQFLGDKLVSWMSKKQDSLPEERFQYLVRRIGMRCLTPAELEDTLSGLNKITDDKVPVPIRFEWDDKKTLMPLGDHASHWSNYLGELIREMPLYYPSWQKVSAKQKAAIVTKIGGGLHQVSWFQYLPSESDPNLSDRSGKLNQRDVGAQLVLSSHLQLQKDGFLSTWGNSFVGPWDPSQGLHNPDEKIKLWLFIPGRHSSVPDKAKAALSKLRGLASGVWLAPGDSEEVAAALSQALRNCIERALTGLSYMRFGDVFSRYHSSSQGELFRRGQPVLEFTFTATEEAVFVHVIISAKHVRALSNNDMETIVKRTSSQSSDRLPVIVSPHGMRGRLTGFCPGDLVKQLYFSSGKSKASNGIVGLPQMFSQSSGCQLRGQNCYLEVTLGCENAESEKPLPSNSNKNISKQHISESPGVTKENEKTFIYPAEAVLVPVVQTFWLQNWMGPSLSGSSFSVQCDAFGTMEGSWHDNGIRSQLGYNSSGNSNSSSSTSSSSDRMTGDDLEADADSTSCIKSGLNNADQMNIDGSKMGNKRTRAGMNESYGQAGGADAYNSMEINEQGGSQWDWDDDDRGVVMDIQALLSEFGDFGDFFENDALPFGEVLN